MGRLFASSGEFEDALAQVETELVASEEIEADHAIYAGAHGQVVSKYLKVSTNVSEGCELSNSRHRPLLDPGCGNDGCAWGR